MNHSFKSFLARTKYRFFNGTGFAGVFTGILAILTFAKVWASTFEYYGVNPVLAYVAIPATYVLLCYSAGFVYEMSGIQALEISHQNQNVNPEVLILLANGKEANERLKEIQNTLLRFP